VFKKSPIKTNRLKLFKTTSAICSENNSKRIDTIRITGLEDFVHCPEC
jgi:hypothetical protein